MSDQPTALFWDVATPFLAQEAVSRGTMMGFPCLRINGDFFASADHRTGDLVVKLAESRVNELIAAGVGQPFVPAGRRFRQWVAIPNRDAEQWRQLIAEAMRFVQEER